MPTQSATELTSACFLRFTSLVPRLVWLHACDVLSVSYKSCNLLELKENLY